MANDDDDEQQQRIRQQSLNATAIAQSTVSKINKLLTQFLLENDKTTTKTNNNKNNKNNNRKFADVVARQTSRWWSWSASTTTQAGLERWRDSKVHSRAARRSMHALSERVLSTAVRSTIQHFGRRFDNASHLNWMQVLFILFYCVLLQINVLRSQCIRMQCVWFFISFDWRVIENNSIIVINLIPARCCLCCCFCCWWWTRFTFGTNRYLWLFVFIFSYFHFHFFFFFFFFFFCG